ADRAAHPALGLLACALELVLQALGRHVLVVRHDVLIVRVETAGTRCGSGEWVAVTTLTPGRGAPTGDALRRWPPGWAQRQAWTRRNGTQPGWPRPAATAEARYGTAHCGQGGSSGCGRGSRTEGWTDSAERRRGRS